MNWHSAGGGATSAGAVETRAASGIEHFDKSQGTLRRRVEACEVGRAAVMLVSDYRARSPGEMVHFDAWLPHRRHDFPLKLTT
jgi:enoyl-[acyl-carrier protein] reductase I